MTYSNTEINKAGDIIRSQKDGTEYTNAIMKLNQWREAHGKTMDYYFDLCSKLAKRMNRKNIKVVAQRLKRLPTIIDKLQRYPEMRLSNF